MMFLMPDFLLMGIFWPYERSLRTFLSYGTWKIARISDDLHVLMDIFINVCHFSAFLLMGIFWPYKRNQRMSLNYGTWKIARTSGNSHILMEDLNFSAFLQPVTLWWLKPTLILLSELFTFGDWTHKRWYPSAVIGVVPGVRHMLFIRHLPITYFSNKIGE